MILQNHMRLPVSIFSVKIAALASSKRVTYIITRPGGVAGGHWERRGRAERPPARGEAQAVRVRTALSGRPGDGLPPRGGPHGSLLQAVCCQLAEIAAAQLKMRLINHAD
jgi:hypothetical protein